MKKLALVLLATAALAVPAAADACHGGRHHARHDARRHARGTSAHLVAWEHGRKLGWWRHGALIAMLDGTGSNFDGSVATASGTFAGRPLRSGAFSASVSTDWTKAVANRHGGTCAPSTGSLSLADSSSSANAVTETLSGKTCTVGANRWNVAYVLLAKSTVSSATGTLSRVAGTGRVLLAVKTDGTVKGVVFSGLRGHKAHTMRLASLRDARRCGWNG
ncbi:MAG TPA: hypothetical protein VFK17_07955 [Gaiellaceae bacterium]|nr:hypothetical protein [Gaiellaceae bacterium]